MSSSLHPLTTPSILTSVANAPSGMTAHVTGLQDMPPDILYCIAEKGLSPLSVANLCQTTRSLRDYTAQALQNGTTLSITTPEQLGQGTFGAQVHSLFIDIPLDPGNIRQLCLAFPNLTQMKFGPTTNRTLTALGDINIKGARISENCLQPLLSYCKNLTSIALEGPGVTDAHIRAIATNCPKLHTLALLKTQATDSAIASLAAACPAIEDFDLNGTSVGIESITAIATHCPKLKYLMLRNTQANDACLATLAAYCPGLEMVELNRPAITDSGAGLLIAFCKRLNYLNLSSTAVTDLFLRLLAPISPHKNLVELDLSGTKVTGDSVAAARLKDPNLDIIWP